MYQTIAAHPTVREIYARTLVARGAVTEAQAAEMNTKYLNELQQVLDGLKPEQDLVEPIPPPPPAGAAAKVTTAVPLDRLIDLNTQLLRLPDGFSVHKKLIRGREKRAQIFAQPTERTVDWAAAEDLAYATILSEGMSIRLTGEDVQRGTFSHRHAVLHDPTTGARFTPAAVHAPGAGGVRDPQQPAYRERDHRVRVRLQRAGALASGDLGSAVRRFHQRCADDHRRVHRLGARQVGTTSVAGAAAAARARRAGPDHASARPERFLQLAADINMRIANCTTAAQYFHLLRRQAALLLVDPLPLVILTPKSLLRHPMVASTPQELAEGRFQQVIDDPDAQGRAADIRRVVLCTGKIFVDLVGSDKRASATQVAVCRVEQLYPLHTRGLRTLLDGYSAADEIVWIQEEPENMGYWDFVRPYLEDAANGRPVRLIARPRSASPAEGSSTRHAHHQQILVEAALAPFARKTPGRTRTGTQPAPEKVAG